MEKNYKICLNIINVIFYLKQKSIKNIGLKLQTLEEAMEKLNYSINTMKNDELVLLLNDEITNERCNPEDISYLLNFYSNIYIDLINQSSKNEKSQIFFDLILKSYSYNVFVEGILNNKEYKQSYLNISHKYKYLNKLKVPNPKQKIYDIIEAEFNKRKI
jgi:hypothetical protein